MLTVTLLPVYSDQCFPCLGSFMPWQKTDFSSVSCPRSILALRPLSWPPSLQASLQVSFWPLPPAFNSCVYKQWLTTKFFPSSFDGLLLRPGSSGRPHVHWNFACLLISSHLCTYPQVKRLLPSVPIENKPLWQHVSLNVQDRFPRACQ